MTRYIIPILILMLGLVSCIEDGFSSSPADQPKFSTDTLKMGVVFTAEQTATHRFLVFNPHDKGMNISSIRITGENAGMFRMNVDGLSGKDFSNVEIRANDSIFVFVSADIPENGDVMPRNIDASMEFEVNGVISKVVISADGQDITRLRGTVITEDTRYTAGKPYQVTDSLVIEEGATLTLEAGTRLLFHDKAWLIVRGTLISDGTPDAPVILTGDRMGNVITDVSFDLMSRQWEGVEIWSASTANVLRHTEISNTTYGVAVYGAPDADDTKLKLINCRLRNSGGNTLTVLGANIEAYGCEFAEAANTLVYLAGGNHRFDHCTVSNHYLFAAVSGAAWTFADALTDEDGTEIPEAKALITNSITWGLGTDVYPGDLAGRDVWFKGCMFKAEGTDDDNFVDSYWGSDPMFYTVRSEYLFDYRVKPESPAIGAAREEFTDWLPETDWYGQRWNGDLGAYVFTPPTDTE